MKKLILSVGMIIIMIIGLQIYIEQQQREELRQQKIEQIKQSSSTQELSQEEEIKNGSVVISDKVYNEEKYEQFKKNMAEKKDANIRIVNINNEEDKEKKNIIYELTINPSGEVEVKYNKNSKIYKTIGVLTNNNIEYLIVTNQEEISISNLENYLVIAKIEKKKSIEN